ncbi:helix-turn-helix domain-containing protein [Chitinophaga sp. Cy-1792]|uniref:helix-turn-helix domain-containing protein n=1 Tax=Chitinophaga sp. Cy-1792 TaxID=2608339 RepID=UPI00141E9B09|nr:helix-turn-helix domain-containing protein [Chitinophaga sp. Cy-1792]NIG57477.1 helix-turn-helix domain-containing protein [Chitinophaga sp. Cy-1792]
MAKQTVTQEKIPQYALNDFRHLHRAPSDDSSFGYNNLPADKKVKGFELYSSEGLVSAVGPLKSDFYRMSITLAGGVDVKLGLEEFRHRPGTISFTYPGQVFSKCNIQPDTFGYYALFEADFLGDFLPPDKFQAEFPFFSVQGQLFIQLTADQITVVADFVNRINAELQQLKPGREKAIAMYFYLLLLEIKRSYIDQNLHLITNDTRQAYLVPRFNKLVSQHYLTKRKVADYAAMLGVTPNHLNRTIKEASGRTASDAITSMLIQESRALLRYTDDTIANISYQLDFSDPAGFSRFFKEQTGLTPQQFRKNA